jgi:riboflavin synthase
MFTGITHSLGVVLGIKKLNNQLVVRIKPEFKISDFQIGESIAVNGCCLTVTKYSDTGFEAYISTETFICTN